MRTVRLAGGLVLCAAVTMALASARDDALIVDEVPHLTAGYAYLALRDMRLNPEHPPLVKDLAALPLLFSKVDETALHGPVWRAQPTDQWDIARAFLFGSGNDPDLLARRGRPPLMLFFALAVALVYCWGERLYGPAGAFLATVLLAFDPTVLAHARFVTTDAPALCGVLLSLFCFLAALRRPTRLRIATAGLALGVALLVKFSTLLLLPFQLAVGLAWGLRSRARARGLANALMAALAVFVVAFLLVVCVYLFQSGGYPAARQRRDTAARLSEFDSTSLNRAVLWLSDKPVLRAAGHYALGAVLVRERYRESVPVFLLGATSERPSPLYFPLVYFLKEPLAWWGLVIIALATWFAGLGSVRPLDGDASFDRAVMLSWIAVYFAACLGSSLTLGVRHLLPIYPFAILLVSGQLASATAAAGPRARGPLVLAVAALAAWYALESVRAYPSFLAYFNQIAGGPSGGHRYVVDSNLDWGQDLRRLSTWMGEHGIQPLELDYFGQSDPRRYLGTRVSAVAPQTYPAAADFLRTHPRGGWIAVSATRLQLALGAGRGYEWLAARKPAAVIGHSIFVWRVE